MISAFRRSLDSWVARIFFALLVGVFVLWGIGDVFKNIGQDSAVATVGGARIEVPEVMEAYRLQLQQVSRMFGGKIDPTPEMRRSIAAEALEQVITQTALRQSVANLGITAPDPAVREVVVELPVFKNAAGQFDRSAMAAVLRNNNLTEPRFLGLMRDSIGQRQLTEPVRAGAVTPDVLVREVFAFQQERRVAEIVDLSFNTAPTPGAPDDAALHRWYDNHRSVYSLPEYRRIKLVMLDPAVLGRDLAVTDSDIAAAYEQRRAEFHQPERRSLQVLLASDEAEARRLAALWATGADWSTMQKENNAAVELPGAIREAIPSPELAAAAFAAVPGVVAPPVQSAFGWQVYKVTAITPGSERGIDEVRDMLRARLAADKAADLVFERSAKIDDLLAGGMPLDELPGDFGLTALAGTLDQAGLTPEGQAAPLPGDDATRRAIVQAVFAMSKDQPPHLTEAPRGADGAPGYFAIALEEVTPPAAKPYETVAAAVLEDWTRDAVRRAVETEAAAIMTAVKAGRSLAEAAPGIVPRRLAPAQRAGGGDGVPAQLITPLFGLKPGEPTMVETADGFAVAVLAEVLAADATTDGAGFSKTRDQLGEAVANDLQALLTVALRKRQTPKVNAAVLNSISQAPQ